MHIRRLVLFGKFILITGAASAAIWRLHVTKVQLLVINLRVHYRRHIELRDWKNEGVWASSSRLFYGNSL